MKAIIWKDKTITYSKGQSTFTEKIVSENKDYYTVVGIGKEEKLWYDGNLVGRRVYKNEELIKFPI